MQVSLSLLLLLLNAISIRENVCCVPSLIFLWACVCVCVRKRRRQRFAAAFSFLSLGGGGKKHCVQDVPEKKDTILAS